MAMGVAALLVTPLAGRIISTSNGWFNLDQSGYHTVVFASAVISPLLGGYLADAVSYQFIFGFSSVGRFIGVALFVFLTVRHSRERH